MGFGGVSLLRNLMSLFGSLLYLLWEDNIYLFRYFFSFRGKSADFVLMFLFGAAAMITCAFFVNLLFLGQVTISCFCALIEYVVASHEEN